MLESGVAVPSLLLSTSAHSTWKLINTVYITKVLPLDHDTQRCLYAFYTLLGWVELILVVGLYYSSTCHRLWFRKLSYVFLGSTFLFSAVESQSAKSLYFRIFYTVVSASRLMKTHSHSPADKCWGLTWRSDLSLFSQTKLRLANFQM